MTSETKLTVYLAGKMTGDPNYKTKFDLYAAQLGSTPGWIVVNPAMLPEDGFEYEQYMNMSGALLKECDAIMMLPDWQESSGARRELATALMTEKRIMFYKEWAAE